MLFYSPTSFVSAEVVGANLIEVIAARQWLDPKKSIGGHPMEALRGAWGVKRLEGEGGYREKKRSTCTRVREMHRKRHARHPFISWRKRKGNRTHNYTDPVTACRRQDNGGTLVDRRIAR